MKKLVLGSLLIVIITIGVLSLPRAGFASSLWQATEEQLVRGAQLFDDWTKLAAPAPALEGSHPIWARQETNTLSGIDTYRCVVCHGWDYQGADGAFRVGSANFTGFPGIYAARDMDSDDLIDTLTGKTDPEHDFSQYLGSEDLDALAAFIQSGLIDDNLFIDAVSLKVLDGDLENGEKLYSVGCASCHGEDGTTINFRYEGQDIFLGKLAVQDPWRFLHRTRFGTARAPEMTIGTQLGWTEQDGRDVLLYAQTLPTGLEMVEEPSLGEKTPGTGDEPGGPANSLLTGIITAIGALATSLGFAVVLGALLIGVIFLIVWVLRSRN